MSKPTLPKVAVTSSAAKLPSPAGAKTCSHPSSLRRPSPKPKQPLSSMQHPKKQPLSAQPSLTDIERSLPKHSFQYRCFIRRYSVKIVDVAGEEIIWSVRGSEGVGPLLTNLRQNLASALSSTASSSQQRRRGLPEYIHNSSSTTRANATCNSSLSQKAGSSSSSWTWVDLCTAAEIAMSQLPIYDQGLSLEPPHQYLWYPATWISKKGEFFKFNGKWVQEMMMMASSTVVNEKGPNDANPAASGSNNKSEAPPRSLFGVMPLAHRVWVTAVATAFQFFSSYHQEEAEGIGSSSVGAGVPLSLSLMVGAMLRPDRQGLCVLLYSERFQLYHSRCLPTAAAARKRKKQLQQLNKEPKTATEEKEEVISLSELPGPQVTTTGTFTISQHRGYGEGDSDDVTYTFMGDGKVSGRSVTVDGSDYGGYVGSTSTRDFKKKGGGSYHYVCFIEPGTGWVVIQLLDVQSQGRLCGGCYQHVEEHSPFDEFLP